VAPWVIIGCGYTGTVLARRLLAEGEGVVVTRRDAEAARTLAATLAAEAPAVAPPHAAADSVARGIAADLGQALEPVPAGAVVVCLAPPGADPAGEIGNLVAAAHDARRLVYVSSTGVYAPGGGAWVDESFARAPATAAGRARVAAEDALPPSAVVLRAAGIYGPGRGLADRLRAGTYRIIGDGRAHVSRVHVDDLVEAIVRAGRGTATGAFNIADDDPAPIGELADALAAQLGVAPPPRVSAAAVDPEIAGMLAADRRIANARMKRELGVVLRYPSLRS
jgi:nucleoside-diphosphate-sugar epimerase